MAKNLLTQPHLTNELAAQDFLIKMRWPEGITCVHCQGEKVYTLNVRGSKRRVLKCGKCRKQFSPTVGTIFEDSHIALTKWFMTIHLMCSSKKGISTQQLKRTLEVDQKTAWFLGHRIRLGMESGDLRPFGHGGGPVEVDETFIGRDPSKKLGVGYEHKMKVLTLIDRETGRSRSMVVDKLTIKDVTPILQANIAKEAHVMTDQAGYYYYLGDHFAKHDVVNHAKDEYARKEGDLTITTNNLEGFFSVFKRGMKGTYQHCRKQHLHRYLAEFDFRYTNRIARGVDDNLRTRIALEGFKGKRLTYRGADSVVA